MDKLLQFQAIEKLRKAQKNGDTEAAHSNADDVLCDVLKSEGYIDIVAEWEKVKKWYA